MNEVLISGLTYALSGLLLAIQDLKYLYVNRTFFFFWVFIQAFLVYDKLDILSIVIMSVISVFIYGYNQFKKKTIIQPADVIFLCLSGMILTYKNLPFFLFNFLWISLLVSYFQKRYRINDEVHLPFITVCYLNTLISLAY